jgi:hypothetical protein
MNQTVQLIFLGYWDHIDRVKLLLRKYIPHKVYFIKGEEHAETEKEVQDFVKKMRVEIEKELPQWVRDSAEEVEMPFFDFEKIFPKMLSIMVKERKEGNEVIANLHGASLMMAAAAAIAASMTGSKTYWVLPERWSIYKNDKDIMLKPVGAGAITEVNIPMLPMIPLGAEKHVLAYLLKNDSNIKGKLSGLSEQIGLDNLGANIKKPSSGIVKLSKTIKKLRDSGYVETKRISRKTFEISLTHKGKMIAEVVALL